MQATQSSQKVAAKASSKNSKNTSNVNQGSTSRTRNTSDNSGGGAGGRTIIFCDGKNVTPKSLAPRKPANESKTDDETAPKLDDENPIEITAVEDTNTALIPPPPKAKSQKAAGLTADELQRTVDLVLSETETDTILFYPSLCVNLDNDALTASVKKRNKDYEELVNSKADSDQYREQHAQTLNHQPKAKEVLAAPPEQESVEVNANTWDIYDTFATDPVPKHVQIQNACEKESEATVALAIKKPGCLFSMNDPFRSDEPAKKDTAAAKDKTKTRGKAKAGVSSSGSKSLAGGQTTDSVNGPSSGYTEEHESTGLAAGQSGGVGSPTAAENNTTAPTSPVQDLEEEEEKVREPVDPIPWKIGANNVIPEELSEALRVMERIVSQNVFHKQHMIYRDYPTLEELERQEKLDKMREDEVPQEGSGQETTAGRRSVLGASVDEAGENGNEELDPNAEEEREEPDHEEATSAKPKLQDLFCFEAPQLTQGVTVTCAEWNTHNQDLLAVSYGSTDPVPNVTKGLVLFWSLKNPTFPERVIRTRTGVTALHFSSAHPNMVSAGTHDGSVMIWDLRRPSDQPVLTSGSSVSTHNDQKHTDVVWETKWVDRGPEKQPPELLVSVSSDGNVYEWSMKKGLEQTLLMQLKRTYNPYLGSNSVYGPKEGMVFRKSSGFCVDFPRGDSSTYLVGTEDGLVHRCSTSYNEQYLATYEGHSGPVYRVRCNPFLSHAFLTCSADWSMKLWSTKSLPGHKANTHLRNFQSTDLCDAVNDVIWAPHNSTSFAACMDDGRVELWDLSAGASDPIVVHYPRESHQWYLGPDGHMYKRRRTCVRFSPNSPVLIAGDDQGSVDVMRMYNTDVQYYSDQEQQDRLNAVMVKKR